MQTTAEIAKWFLMEAVLAVRALRHAADVRTKSSSQLSVNPATFSCTCLNAFLKDRNQPTRSFGWQRVV